MNKKLVRTALTTDQMGEAVQLDYYLLTEYMAGLEQYGTEVVLRRGQEDERCAVPCITPLASSMARIIGLLAEATVTPTGLRDVLEDIL